MATIDWPSGTGHSFPQARTIANGQGDAEIVPIDSLRSDHHSDVTANDLIAWRARSTKGAR